MNVHSRQFAMRVFGITRIGLCVLTLSVAVLWVCFVSEKVIRRGAERDLFMTRHILEELREKRGQSPVPVSRPTPARTPAIPSAA